MESFHPMRDEYREYIKREREPIKEGGGGEQESGKEYKKKW